MKFLIALTALALAIAVPSYAQDTESGQPSVTISGNVVS
jgi:hypothetical protein